VVEGEAEEAVGVVEAGVGEAPDKKTEKPARLKIRSISMTKAWVSCPLVTNGV
jgi:hypothetical protein